MRFEEKYISQKESDTKPNAKRILITDEAFAIGEIIQIVVDKLGVLSLKK